MSIYSALTALTSQQTKLDVIGNNLANVSTVAYKGQSVAFSDLLSQTISGASAASTDANTGGTNSQQVGLGVSVSSITTDVTNGSTTYTGVDTDVSIGGNGYFIVEGEKAGSYYYTRAGNFGVDASGNLNVNGYKVCGWLPDSGGAIDTEAAVSAINLFYNTDGTSKQVIAPEATTYAKMKGTLDSTTTAQGDSLADIGLATEKAALSGTLNKTSGSTSSQTVTIVDKNGTSSNATVTLTTGATTKYYTAGDTTGTELTAVAYTIADSTGTTTASGTLYFNSNGEIVTSGSYYDTSGGTGTLLTLGAAKPTATVDSVSVAFDFSSMETGSATSLTVTADGGPPADSDATATISVYDALGNEYDVNVDYTKCATSTVYDSSGNALDITTVYWAASDTSDNVNASGSGYLAFDSKGKLVTGEYTSE